MQRFWKQAGAASRGVMILLGAVALVAGVLVPTQLVGATGDHDAVDYAQCANRTDLNTGCEKWINGILNANNSFYRENEVTPQRLTVTVEDVSTNPCTVADQSGCHSITLSYLTRKGTNHAYDSLATWNHTQGTANRCDGLTPPVKAAIGCTGGSSSDTLPVAADTTDIVQPFTNGGGLTTAHDLDGQVLEMWSAAATGVDLVLMTDPTHDNAAGPGDDYATTTIYYKTATTGKVQLLFGGHLAAGPQSIGWGTGLGASDISGGPYHIRWTANDVSAVGSRDNQIMSGAIQPLADVNITTLVRLSDSATLVGWDSTGDRTGDVTFSLYGPGDTGCATPVFTQTLPDVATSTLSMTSTGFYTVPLNATGTYNWVVTYQGDSKNSPSASLCGSEVVTVNYNF